MVFGVRELLRRSIPAGAGKPDALHSSMRSARVYPRGRGEATTTPRPSRTHRGLSPRARGSHRLAWPEARDHGSIPAGAGKPCAGGRVCRAGGVYPRGRGEAPTWAAGAGRSEGLSPRARGSLVFLADRHEVVGSIPAGAGKPGASLVPRNMSGVYPRGRGEALRGKSFYVLPAGLSPRARGSRLRRPHVCSVVGSIPAGAGKPVTRWGRLSASGVYPRGRGEAWPEPVLFSSRRGLSPRARGSRSHEVHPLRRRGSIPAGAGKPL